MLDNRKVYCSNEFRLIKGRNKVLEGIKRDISVFLADNYVEKKNKTFRTVVLDRVNYLKKTGHKEESEIYKRGNIDRRLYNSLKHGNDDYKPEKTTALAYCIALKLNINEAEELLYLTEYRFKEDSLTDQIVRYCIINRIYSADAANILINHFSKEYKIEKINYIGKYVNEGNKE